MKIALSPWKEAEARPLPREDGGCGPVRECFSVLALDKSSFLPKPQVQPDGGGLNFELSC
jgi:hypothetical protein